MIQAIILDFDGVIVESADIKTRAFRKLFEDIYPNIIEEIVQHHIDNMGISRYEKFRFIYNHIVGMPLSADEEKQLGERFSAIVLDEVLQAPFVPGVKNFLKLYSYTHKLFVASGTPEYELLNIIKGRELTSYFHEIHGSPKDKVFIINKISSRYGYLPTEVVLIGDATSDLKAACQTGIQFIARIDGQNSELSKCRYKIRDFTALTDIDEFLAK